MVHARTSTGQQNRLEVGKRTDMHKIDWPSVGKQLVDLAIGYVKEEVAAVANDMAELRALGGKLGVPFVPGEDFGEYRKRVVAARDAKK